MPTFRSDRFRAVSCARTAIDLFAGAGGTTQGLVDAGYTVLAAIENDPDAAKSYAANHPDVDLRDVDILTVDPAEMRDKHGVVDVLTACPPCQGFSTLGRQDPDDERNDLVASVVDFADALEPRAILLENVPGLGADGRLDDLEAALRDRYVARRYVVDAADFGVPQHRRRIIVVLVRLPFDRDDLPTDLIAALPDSFDVAVRPSGPVIDLAGALNDTTDSVHRARTPSKLTVERISVMPVGGGRLDLPEHLRLKCHDRLEGTHATSIYGRIDPTKPSPTMTTRCTTPSCGRFAHPTENRGLSLREAALLQSFPPAYRFYGNYGQVERQIGNAVPVRLAHALGLVADRLLARRDAANTTVA